MVMTGLLFLEFNKVTRRLVVIFSSKAQQRSQWDLNRYTSDFQFYTLTNRATLSEDNTVQLRQ